MLYCLALFKTGRLFSAVQSKFHSGLEHVCRRYKKFFSKPSVYVYLDAKWVVSVQCCFEYCGQVLQRWFHRAAACVASFVCYQLLKLWTRNAWHGSFLQECWKNGNCNTIQYSTVLACGWQFSSVVTCWTVGLDQHSYSMLGPVGAWMGDRLRADKLSQYVTSHPGQLSLAIPLWVGQWVPA